MTTTFKTRFWILSKWLGSLFILLFIFRLLYGYFATDLNNAPDYSENFFSSVDNLRKNYASEKISIKGNVQQQASIASNQKYEKTATVKSKTSDFEEDETDIKKITKQFNAVIQYEQNLGNKGSRELHLLIGVNPNSFDSFYLATQKIGIIRAREITKIDKTNEYRKLNAKKVSLETTLSSLNELKSKAGQIGDFVTLHDKILEIETQLQELGVELGDFDAENEFCTVRFSLYEGAAEKKVGIFQRTKIALEWTIKYYAILVFSLFGLCCVTFIILLIVDKLNVLKNISNKLNQ
jgi:Domain of unknown function (DUF4349)